MQRPFAVIRSGFTLVELLVVISIIALLISILLPSLEKARESARSIQCGSNMRSIGQANAFYTGDHDGLFVPLSYPTGNGGNVWWWTNKGFREPMGMPTDRWMSRGAKRDQLCPNAYWPNRDFHQERGGRIRFSYAPIWPSWSGYNSYGDRSGKMLGGFTQGGIEAPGHKIHWGDSLAYFIEYPQSTPGHSRFYFNRGGETPYPGSAWGGPARPEGASAYRHHTDLMARQGIANFLYFDGHVEAKQPGEVDTAYRWQPRQ